MNYKNRDRKYSVQQRINYCERVVNDPSIDNSNPSKRVRFYQGVLMV